LEPRQEISDEHGRRASCGRADPPIADDDESAHAAEDRLHESVLQSIADGTAEDPKAMAAAALKTDDIEFSRWFA